MAQFSLPQNSKIVVGEYYKDKTSSKNLRKLMFIGGIPQQGRIQELILLKSTWIIVGQRSLIYCLKLKMK